MPGTPARPTTTSVRVGCIWKRRYPCGSSRRQQFLRVELAAVANFLRELSRSQQTDSHNIQLAHRTTSDHERRHDKPQLRLLDCEFSARLTFGESCVRLSTMERRSMHKQMVLMAILSLATGGRSLSAGDVFCASRPTRCPTSMSTPQRMPVYSSVYRRQVQPLPTTVNNYWHSSCTPRRSMLPKQNGASMICSSHEVVRHSYCPVCENYRPHDLPAYRKGAYCPAGCAE